MLVFCNLPRKSSFNKSCLKTIPFVQNVPFSFISLISICKRSEQSLSHFMLFSWCWPLLCFQNYAYIKVISGVGFSSKAPQLFKSQTFLWKKTASRSRVLYFLCFWWRWWNMFVECRKNGLISLKNVLFTCYNSFTLMRECSLPLQLLSASS